MALDPRLILLGAQQVRDASRPISNLLSGVQTGQNINQNILAQQQSQQNQALKMEQARQAAAIQQSQAPLNQQILQQQATAGQQALNQNQALQQKQDRIDNINRLSQAAAIIKPFIESGDVQGASAQLEGLSRILPPDSIAELSDNLASGNLGAISNQIKSIETLASQVNIGQTLDERKLDIREKELKQRKELKQLEPTLAGNKQTKILEAELGLKPQVEGAITKAKEDVKAATDLVSKSFDRIGSITTNIRNIDRAIGAIDRGAETGVIDKLVPSITSASRELKQIQNELGLDVIGSVTFGALSQGELDLALDTALDTGQEPEALRAILVQKKEAQNKLVDYLDEQISFLDSGGTLAGWREKKRSESSKQATIDDLVSKYAN